MRTTTGNPSILRGTQLFGYKFKLMNRNFIQGHPFHLVEPSPYLLLVSLALLITTLSGVMTFHCYSNGAFLLSLLCFLSTVFAVTISLQGEPKGDLLLRFLICLLLVVYII